MKLFLIVLAACALALTAQDYSVGQLKHLSTPTGTSVRPVSITALEIDRVGPAYPAIVHLKGNVEIRTPVCLVTGPENKLVCDGSVVLHADEAHFHEDTGEIEATGNVRVTREAYDHRGR